MDYICLSDQGDVHYPYTPADFDAMLAREDLTGRGEAEYRHAAQLYVHLQDITHQDAGWTENQED